MFERLDVAPAYKVVSETIEREILNGRLIPGQQLPTETALASQFGLTRHTVREGIRILEQGGLVRREAGRRLYVALPRYADLAPRMSRALAMQRVTFSELWEVSLVIETRAAGLAADRIEDPQLDILAENVEAMAAALKAGRSIVDLDVAFHTVLAEAARNRALLLAREPISLLFYPALDMLFRHRKTRKVGPARLLEAHRHILQALQSRDATSAETWMRKHMIDFRRGFLLCGLDVDAALDTGTGSPAPA